MAASGLERMSMLRATVDPGRLRYYRHGLRAWFREHGRDLPWRRTNDPYRILVSEIMLQQTQAPRVAEVYEEFVQTYPRIEDVAEARLRDVRRITDPLGYKARGGYIKRIADEAVAYRAGRLPESVPELMQLPGVGCYTAGAVMTFAHGRATPIVDTNVARVLSRWFADAFPADDSDSRREKRLWALAAALLPSRGPGYQRVGWEINQALMDLGAQLCVARRPRCGDCPLRRRCHYRRRPAAQPRSGAFHRHLG
jgi:A/G-specific adenine glycosylase